MAPDDPSEKVRVTEVLIKCVGCLQRVWPAVKVRPGLTAVAKISQYVLPPAAPHCTVIFCKKHVPSRRHGVQTWPTCWCTNLRAELPKIRPVETAPGADVAPGASGDSPATDLRWAARALHSCLCWGQSDFWHALLQYRRLMHFPHAINFENVVSAVCGRRLRARF